MIIEARNTMLGPLKTRKSSDDFLALWLVVIGVSAGMVGAVLNEGISLALEAAHPYVKEGFKIREDNWSGETDSGKPLLVKHQLFKGNEYWFWAATSFPNSDATVGVFDDKGNAVTLETFSKEGKAGARVLPKKTGSYFIRVTVSSKEYATLDWGLVYGYR